MNINDKSKSGAGFRGLDQEELFDTFGGRFLSWGASSGYVFLTSFVRDLFNKEDQK